MFNSVFPPHTDTEFIICNFSNQVAPFFPIPQQEHLGHMLAQFTVVPLEALYARTIVVCKMISHSVT